MSDKYHDTVAASRVIEDDAAVKAAVEKILAEHFDENNNKEVYKFLFNTIDLTTLKTYRFARVCSRFCRTRQRFRR